MNKNILHSSGSVISIAVGENYTLKTNEVFINGIIYKKKEVEISIFNNSDTSLPENVKIAIRNVGNKNNKPADFLAFNKWVIDDVVQTSLSTAIENITTSLYYE